MITSIKDNLSLWGLAPEKLISRFSSQEFPKILANSIPKSGTHLMERLLYLLPGISRQLAGTFWIQQAAPFERRCTKLKKGQFLVSHLYYQEAFMEILMKYDIKPILLVRDPRDVVLSNVNYVTRANKKHRLHDFVASHLKADRDRLHFFIKGSRSPHEYSIAELLEKFHPWTQSGKVLTIRFEDLIGEAGGGSAKKQRQSVELLLDFIGVQLNAEQKMAMIQKIFHTGSKTFNKGRINQWKKRFNETDKQLFKEVAGDWLIKYGYEKDHSW